MKIWIYGRDEREIFAMLAYGVGNSDTIIGFSVQKPVGVFSGFLKILECR